MGPARHAPQFVQVQPSLIHFVTLTFRNRFYQGLSPEFHDLPFRQRGSIHLGLPHDPCVDPRMIFCGPFDQKLGRVGHSLPVAEENNAIGLTQRLSNPTVEGEVFRRALSLFL
jgi:hypothetical protein